jgi:hypothetical protein
MLLVISSILTRYASTNQYIRDDEAILEGNSAIPEGDSAIPEGDSTIPEGDSAIHEEVKTLHEEDILLEGPAIRHWPTRAARMTSIIFRRLGKLIAAINSLWVVVACIFQFASVFDNCYCNSSVFYLHDHAYNVIALLPGDVTSVKSAWVGGLFLAGGTAIIYVLFVNVLIDPPLPAD